MAKKYPVEISTRQNEITACYDLGVFVGNFSTQTEAQEYGKRIAEFLESEANAELLRVQ